MHARDHFDVPDVRYVTACRNRQYSGAGGNPLICAHGNGPAVDVYLRSGNINQNRQPREMSTHLRSSFLERGSVLRDPFVACGKIEGCVQVSLRLDPTTERLLRQRDLCAPYGSRRGRHRALEQFERLFIAVLAPKLHPLPKKLRSARVIC
jgi:hypothetical protein